MSKDWFRRARRTDREEVVVLGNGSLDWGRFELVSDSAADAG